MRLIDADRLKSYIDCGHLRPPTEVCFSEIDVCNMIDKAPTVSADAVQGEWIFREYCTNELDYRRWIEIECPFCGEIPTYENLDNMNFCPNCGARMKGGAE